MHSETVPTSFFMAIALAANALIFPESLNSSWTYVAPSYNPMSMLTLAIRHRTDLVDTYLIPILQRSQLHSKLLLATPPLDDKSSAAWSAIDGEFLGSGARISGGLDGLLGSVSLMELEISYGRLGAKDLIGLSELLRQLLARSMALGVLSSYVDSGYKVCTFAEERESVQALKRAEHRGQPRGTRDRKSVV